MRVECVDRAGRISPVFSTVAVTLPLIIQGSRGVIIFASKMTGAQVVWQVVIGLFLLAVWEVVQPLFKKLWSRMNKPAPLSPRDKGNLVEQIATMEYGLEQLNHFAEHPKDLVLLLFQMLMGAFLSCIVAVCMYAYHPKFLGPLIGADILLLVLVAVVLCLSGILIARRMSDKNIDANRGALLKQINEAKSKLQTSILRQ